MNGFTTDIQQAARILDCEKVESLPYSKSNTPFSLMLVPKGEPTGFIEILQVRFYQQKELGPKPCPFTLENWTEPALVALAGPSDLTDRYDIYAGFGQSAQ